MRQLPIKGLQKTSLVDFPGKICATVFLGGCNFRCGYCYNKELVLETNKAQNISEEEVLAFLQKRKNVLDGVCITGGEPTIHEGLPSFIQKAKTMGVAVKLDTNGTNPSMIGLLLDHRSLDYVAMDIKAPLWKYGMVTPGIVYKNAIQETIQLLLKNLCHYEFRTTLVPGITTEEDIREIRTLVSGAKKFAIQQFKPTKTHLDQALGKEKPFSEEKVLAMKQILEKTIPEVEVRGL